MNPYNRLPALRRLQLAQRDLMPASAGEATLHPYFDDVESAPWLTAQVRQTNPASFRFHVTAPPAWEAVTSARAARHFTVFRLGQLYSAQAAQELINIRRRGQSSAGGYGRHGAVRHRRHHSLHLAVKEGVLDCNPARHIEVRGYQHPHAKVWTDERVASWQQTGTHPAVAVWTAAQLATFLGAVTDDSLYALWWLAGLRGLRRGELCGLRWTDLDLDRAVLTIERNRTTAGYQAVEGDPKTQAGRRSVALDKRTVQVLRTHHRQQLDQRRDALANGRP